MGMKKSKVNRFEHWNVGIVCSFEQHTIWFGELCHQVCILRFPIELIKYNAKICSWHGSHRSTIFSQLWWRNAFDLCWCHIYMLVFHQSNCASVIKHMLFYYCHISIFVFFHVYVRFLLLPCMPMSAGLHVGVKTLYETQPAFYPGQAIVVSCSIKSTSRIIPNFFLKHVSLRETKCMKFIRQRCFLYFEVLKGIVDVVYIVKCWKVTYCFVQYLRNFCKIWEL